MLMFFLAALILGIFMCPISRASLSMSENRISESWNWCLRGSRPWADADRRRSTLGRSGQTLLSTHFSISYCYDIIVIFFCWKCEIKLLCRRRFIMKRWWIQRCFLISKRQRNNIESSNTTVRCILGPASRYMFSLNACFSYSFEQIQLSFKSQPCFQISPQHCDMSVDVFPNLLRWCNI